MGNYKISIFGGTVFGILPNLPIEDIMVTVCMAIIGTISSYVITLVLRWIGKRIERQ